MPGWLLCWCRRHGYRRLHRNARSRRPSRRLRRRVQRQERAGDSQRRVYSQHYVSQAGLQPVSPIFPTARPTSCSASTSLKPRGLIPRVISALGVPRRARSSTAKDADDQHAPRVPDDFASRHWRKRYAKHGCLRLFQRRCFHVFERVLGPSFMPTSSCSASPSSVANCLSCSTVSNRHSGNHGQRGHGKLACVQAGPQNRA